MMAHAKWDQFYNEHGRFYLLPHPAFKRLTNLLRAYKVEKVIDLGCGNGRHLVALAEEGFKVSAIDISPAAVELSKQWLEEKGLEGDVGVADLHEEIKTYPNASFDAIVAVNSLNYDNNEKFLLALKEINRLLRDKGIFFLVVPSKETVIVKPEAEQILFNEQALRLALADTFKILELGQDEEKNFVVTAQEK